MIQPGHSKARRPPHPPASGRAGAGGVAPDRRRQPAGRLRRLGFAQGPVYPFAEQQHPLRRGDRVLVKIYLDKLERVTGSTRIDHWVKDDASRFAPREEVVAAHCRSNRPGREGHHRPSQLGSPVRQRAVPGTAQRPCVTGYIKQIRADGKIDLSLEKPGFSKDRLDSLADRIIDRLEAADGFLPLTDKSPPRRSRPASA